MRALLIALPSVLAAVLIARAILGRRPPAPRPDRPRINKV